MTLSPEDIERIAETGYELFRRGFVARLHAEREQPGWSGLKESARIKWRDLVPDCLRSLSRTSPNQKEACVKAALRAYRRPEIEDPDGAISAWLASRERLKEEA